MRWIRLAVLWLGVGGAGAVAGAAPGGSEAAPDLPTTSGAPGSPSPSGNPAPYLQAILGQLVVMNHNLQRTLEGRTRRDVCKYEEKAYSVGAMVKVGNVVLVCVVSEVSDHVLVAGDHSNKEESGREVATCSSFASTTVKQPRYVWEPLGSPRLERFRALVGLPAKMP